MKSLLIFLIASSVISAATAQDTNKPGKHRYGAEAPSPPAFVEQKLTNGTVVSIDYSQPSVKGRTIGKDIEPLNGKVWRTGANEATRFEISKNVKIEGKELPAGKYGLFTIAGDNEWTIIFSKTWDQWGAYSYKEGDDALRVQVKPGKTKEFVEKMAFAVNKNGKVSLMWGNLQVDFKVE